LVVELPSPPPQATANAHVTNAATQEALFGAVIRLIVAPCWHGVRFERAELLQAAMDSNHLPSGLLARTLRVLGASSL